MVVMILMLVSFVAGVALAEKANTIKTVVVAKIKALIGGSSNGTPTA